MTLAATTFVFPASAYAPIAVGFFGLGVGYFVWGGQGLFGFPAATRESDRSIGMWGIWMPGFMQFITGTYLLVGLTWWHVFDPGTTHTPLYMAGLAFTAYGVHWFVLGARRFIQSDVIPDAWMAIPFALISILGLIVFAAAKDWGVTILFILLALIYLSEAIARFGLLPEGPRPSGPESQPSIAMTRGPLLTGGRLVAFWQFINGCWLMYLTYAVALDLSTTYHWPF
jgi:hypothetical protein